MKARATRLARRQAPRTPPTMAVLFDDVPAPTPPDPAAHCSEDPLPVPVEAAGSVYDTVTVGQEEPDATKLVTVAVVAARDDAAVPRARTAFPKATLKLFWQHDSILQN